MLHFALTVGYVKTTSVEIDFNSLKNQGASLQQAYDPEVYDDIDVIDNRYGIVPVNDEPLMWPQHSFADTDIDNTFENASQSGSWNANGHSSVTVSCTFVLLLPHEALLQFTVKKQS